MVATMCHSVNIFSLVRPQKVKCVLQYSTEHAARSWCIDNAGLLRPASAIIRVMILTVQSKLHRSVCPV